MLQMQHIYGIIHIIKNQEGRSEYIQNTSEPDIFRESRVGKALYNLHS